ncbi:glucosaminidase domain-containing protein [Thalassobellus suaedae]|nr:LysM peptidoglycan-binding domain-containing protein [Flavobacteriaceae bacterium HL-DH14]
MDLYGIPASITLAQGVLESGSGHGTLSVKANNHFGIKCHDWTGAKVYHDDDKKQECFRKYKDAKYSFRDHSLFLTQRKRYANLFKLKKEDYKGWAKGLKAAGYATDKKYPNKLISLIERYELYEFDREVLGESYTKYEAPIVVNNEDKDIIKSNSSTYIVAKGDTMYSIARKYNITVDELKAINGLSHTTLSLGQELQVKKGLVDIKESVNEEITASHIVIKGDTLYSISKKYNMTVKELQNINGLSDLVLSIGQELQVKPTSKN